MSKEKAVHAEPGAGQRKGAEAQLKVGKIEYYEKFSRAGRILQKDGTTISFHGWRTTYPVKEGDIVNYRLESGPLGLQAVDIASLGRI